MRRLLPGLVSLVLAASGVLATPAASAPARESAGTEEPDRPLPRVSPYDDEAFHEHVALAATEVDGPAYRRSRAGYDAVDDALEAAQTERVGSVERLALLEAADRRTTAEIAAATARRDRARQRVEEVDEAIGELATELFIDGGRLRTIDVLDDPQLANQRRAREIISGAAVDNLVGEKVIAATELDAATEQLAVATARVEVIGTDLRAARDLATQSAGRERELATELAPVRRALDAARATATVAGADFSLVALDAYYRAAVLTAESDPACAIRWWGLAGISRVEGRHGTYGGASLDVRGDTNPRIIGIPLNGENNTRHIRDSDGGFYDGDPFVDRAVGPMQFIPDTWRRFADDGNRDGTEDPNNLYDATAAAARYLCRASPNLTEDDGLRAAYFSYNHSLAYVENVLSHARRYETLLDLDLDVDVDR